MAQYYIAQEKPPHLKCIAPWEGAGDQYREMLMRGGIPQTDFMEFVLSAFPGKGKLEDVRAEGAKYVLSNSKLSNH